VIKASPLACEVVERRRLVAWIGGAAVLATAVVALRHTQPPTDLSGAPTTTEQAPSNRVVRFAVDGVLLPEPGEPPAMPREVVAVPSGPDRLRLAWGSALPGGSDPEDAVGYDVRWRASDGRPEQQRLIAVPELQLDGLTGEHYVFEVRSVDAFGQRSAPVRTHARPGNAHMFTPGYPWTGLYEDFSDEFSVDTAGRGNRWHFSGHQGCTRTSRGTGQHTGQLAVDFECGGDLTVLRYRSPLELAAPPAERGRIAVVTDVAGPRGQLTIDLVPAPADQIGAGRDGAPPAVTPSNGTAGTDPTLPAGALRVLVNDDGARVLTGPGVPRVPDPPAPTRAPTRGNGVLHVFEVVLEAGAVYVLQDGTPVAVAGVTPAWTQAHVLIGLSGPPGRRSTVHLDAVGLSGRPMPPPTTFAHHIVAATQRVLGPDEDAPGIGISAEPLRKAAAARLVATVTLIPGVDLDNVILQCGAAMLPARPLLAVPSRTGSLVTVAADLPPDLLGPAAPPSVSPLVLRAPGADGAMVPIVSSYLEIAPLPTASIALPTPAGAADRPPVPDGLPAPAVRLLDSAENLTSTVTAGSRLLVDIDLDRVGGQLESGHLAGVAGFELWMDNRRIAGIPTAIDGPGVGGQYSLAVATRRLQPGPHFLELRVIPTSPDTKRVSRLASFTVTER
jgi:hypothetical protein